MVSNIILSAAAWASTLRSSFVERLKEESGQDLIEYAALAGAIALVAAVAFVALPMQPIISAFVLKVSNCLQLNAGCV